MSKKTFNDKIILDAGTVQTFDIEEYSDDASATLKCGAIAVFWKQTNDDSWVRSIIIAKDEDIEVQLNALVFTPEEPS